MLQKAAKRAIDVELCLVTEDSGYGGASTHEFVRRHYKDPEPGDKQDPEPLGPGAKAALLWDGHEHSPMESTSRRSARRARLARSAPTTKNWGSSVNI